MQLQDELPFDKNKLLNNKHFYEFHDAFIKTEKFGNIKIDGLQIKYDIIISKSQWIFDAERTTKAILKDVLTGEMKFIKKN
ncbi:hypothetical protein D3C86_1026020 [compost metagenome]